MQESLDFEIGISCVPICELLMYLFPQKSCYGSALFNSAGKFNQKVLSSANFATSGCAFFASRSV